jgi:hypothetical protein
VAGGNNKKARVHHPGFGVWRRRGVRRNETYLQNLPEEFNDNKIAAIASFSPNAYTPYVDIEEDRAISDPAGDG